MSKSASRAGSRPPEPPADAGAPAARPYGRQPSKPQLVVVAKPGKPVRAMTAAGRALGLPAPPGRLAAILQQHGAALRPLFGVTEDRVARTMARGVPAAALHGVPDLSAFYHVDAPNAD